MLGADFYRVVASSTKVLGANAWSWLYLLVQKRDFVGLVDLLERKAYVWDDSGLPENFEIVDIPADMVDEVEQYREMMIETALEQDDDLLMAYMEGEEPSIEDVKKCVRKGTIALDFFPTYCGSAFKNKGVQMVLDAVVDYLPCPDILIGAK